MTDALKTRLQQAAQQLGFNVCRVTHAAPPDAGRRLAQWLASGYHGAMQWMERTRLRREDLQAVLPGIRSVVCLAAAYPAPAMTTPEGAGYVAGYARSRDYHEVMGEKLARLSDTLNQWAGPQARSLWYVDTGPVLERALAERAGVGFIGKHTNLISRSHGNWLLLGEILTTVELPPDPPEKNRCGTCQRCLAACPTGAIVAPFQLDARRCISYLTIELKGSIPVELRPLMGRRIFGCDDCLAACPWNRLAGAASPLLAATGRADLAAPDLLELLRLDPAGFRRRFKGTPLERARYRGLMRNVCVALGNVGGAEALADLEKAAAHPEPLIAEHARWAGEQIRKRLRGEAPVEKSA